MEDTADAPNDEDSFVCREVFEVDRFGGSVFRWDFGVHG
jgi:hypothetical protein